MHWLEQFLHKWWALLGLGALLGDVLKRLAGPMIGLLVESYDQRVWDVVKHPRYATSPGGQVLGPGSPPPKLAAYNAAEIARQIKRREFMVTTSLKRLEKRGKVKETHEGWLAA